MARKPRIDFVGYYHVLNRGVERRAIFLEDHDLVSNAKPIPANYFRDEENPNFVMERPFAFQDEKSKNNAENIARRAVKAMLGRNKLSDFKMDHMLYTSSYPIKIRFQQDNKWSRDEIYVKQPELSRLIGKFIYNIISGQPEYKYFFNENAIIEEGIHGNTLARTDERMFN